MLAALAADGYFEFLIAGFVRGATSVPPGFPVDQLVAETIDLTHARGRGQHAWVELPPYTPPEQQA